MSDTFDSARGPEPDPPPPAGPNPAQDPPPPPGTGSSTYADLRARFVRPSTDRWIAGVCGAIARGTHTDPVLWRVLFAVFTLVGGLGAIAYIVCWLLMVQEGDTASPVEAILNKGHSSTSPVVTVLLGVLAFAGAVVFASDSQFLFVMLVAGATAVVLYLLIKNNPSWRRPPVPPSASFAPPSASFAPPTWPAPPTPGAASAAVSMTAAPVRPPKPKREKSFLGRLTFFAALIAVGVLAVVDLTGTEVPVAAYFATALGVVGLGLLVGTWRGRGYALIALGILLAIALGLASVVGPVQSVVRDGGEKTWTPQNVNMIQPEYSIRFGHGTLDLRQVDFTDRTVPIAVRSRFGKMLVLLPPQVDATVTTDVVNGDATVFGTSTSDLGEERSTQAPGTITDLGSDGPGGGKILIDLDVRFGNAEVTR